MRCRMSIICLLAAVISNNVQFYCCINYKNSNVFISLCNFLLVQNTVSLGWYVNLRMWFFVEVEYLINKLWNKTYWLPCVLKSFVSIGSSCKCPWNQITEVLIFGEVEYLINKLWKYTNWLPCVLKSSKKNF